jgi:hypothetical protein
MPLCAPTPSALAAAEAFVELLRQTPVIPNVFNPWRDQDPLNDLGPDSPAIRARNLTCYLAERVDSAKVLLTAEAPGYQGCHFTGIAMTSERILLGNKPNVPPDAVFSGPKSRTSSPAIYPNGANEPTATIAWSLLLELGLGPREFVFWNAFPSHPHRPGALLTNRAPTRPELQLTAHVLPALLGLFANAEVFAVGRVAQAALAGLGVEADAVRHPAMGGASLFREQMRVILGDRPGA